MAESPPPSPPPPFDPAAALPLLEASAGHVLELLAAKVELALVELEEEAKRLQIRLVLMVATSFALGMAFLVLNGAVLWLIIDAVGHGPLVLAGGGAAYLLLALICYLASSHSALAYRAPLSTTLEELRKDSRWLKGAR